MSMPSPFSVLGGKTKSGSQQGQKIGMDGEVRHPAVSRLAELKKQLEGISGQKIDASPEQLISLFFRVSLRSSEDGVIMSRSFIFPGKSCSQASALPANLFDVSSRSSTGADGQVPHGGSGD